MAVSDSAISSVSRKAYGFEIVIVDDQATAGVSRTRFAADVVVVSDSAIVHEETARFATDVVSVTDTASLGANRDARSGVDYVAIGDRASLWPSIRIRTAQDTVPVGDAALGSNYILLPAVPSVELSVLTEVEISAEALLGRMDFTGSFEGTMTVTSLRMTVDLQVDLEAEFALDPVTFIHG